MSYNHSDGGYQFHNAELTACTLHEEGVALSLEVIEHNISTLPKII